MAEEAQFDGAAAHRYFSATCFNKAWEYLDKTDRTSEDDQRMIETALAYLRGRPAHDRDSFGVRMALDAEV